LAGYDGRVSVQSIEKRNFSIKGLKNYISFKAHEIAKGSNIQNLFQINDCGFIQLSNHNSIDSFYTCGGNGELIIWDVQKREKVIAFSCRGRKYSLLICRPC
jgi:hypothetical protein